VAARLTQQEVAGGHFSKSYISAIERGKMTPSVPALEYLAGRLQVPLAYLLGETELNQSASPAPSLTE
jgi:HTH-type transcriptional regulator, quorum sensing regulator NprR